MQILIVSQYFWPENFRINEIVKSLVERGEQVVILTGKPNYPQGKIYDGYRAGGCSFEIFNDIKVFRVPIFPRGFKSPIRLFLNYLSFVLSGLIFGPWLLRKTKFEVIFVYAPSPLLQAIPAIFIAKLRKIPVVLYVQDLWPESLEATGYLRNRFIIRLVESIIKFIYRNVDLILTSSKPFKNSIQRFSPKAKIIYYPNSVDKSFCDSESGIKPDVAVLDSGFCVVFAGNIGSAQAVQVIAEAAHQLKKYSDIRIVIFGSGSELEWLRTQVIERDLTNLYLMGQFPVEAMPNLLSRASALLVTLSDQAIFAATVPNKVQAYMAVGRPIIASMNGEGARLINEANAGLTVKAEDATALAMAILGLYQMPKVERDKLGINAQDYYRKHFNHEILINDLIGYLDNLVKVRK
jgi:glycosyltransferase involved in cell wall biosynthesis